MVHFVLSTSAQSAVSEPFTLLLMSDGREEREHEQYLREQRKRENREVDDSWDERQGERGGS